MNGFIAKLFLCLIFEPDELRILTSIGATIWGWWVMISLVPDGFAILMIFSNWISICSVHLNYFDEIWSECCSQYYVRRRDGGKLSAGVDVTRCKIATNFVLNNIDDLIRG